MAEVTRSRVNVQVNARIVLELNECEARALDGIFGYNVEAFLKAFYEKMGKCYVDKYEEGVRSLHKSIGAAVRGPLSEVDDARRLINTANELRLAEQEAAEQAKKNKPKRQ